MSDESSPPTEHGPLGPLALSLSGGGYRAAAFHLGTLRFLDRMGLLRDVVGLSTVSGGTLTGMAWVVSLLDGKPFPEFHETFSAYLKRTNVIAEALRHLTSHRHHGSHTMASLICSASEVYAQPELFGDRRFGEVRDARAPAMPRELIFNTTEFHSGMDFRFRRTDNPRAVQGNTHAVLPGSVAQHVRLADIVAASSCFPGGFEPIVFPQQFHWPKPFPLRSALEELGPGFDRGLPLMDGGIYDNQGVDSVLLAFEQKTPAPTLLISDVSTHAREIYNVPENPTKRGWVTLNAVSKLAWGLFALTLVSAGILVWHGIEAAQAGVWKPQDYFLYLVPGLLTALVAVALVWVKLRLDDVDTLLRTHVDIDAWPSFQKLTVPEFTQMLVLRVTSMLALTSKVFMKRVRGLILHRVYADPRYEGRRVANLIHTLTDDQPGLYAKHPWMRPRPYLVQQAQQATQMPTTLWFTEDAQCTTVEAAGEATCCYVLLRHLLEDRAGQYESEGLPLHDLYLRLRSEWDVLNREEQPSQPPARVAA